MSVTEPRKRGRPTGSKTTDRDDVVRARVSAPQRETWERLGGADWLRGELNRLAALLERQG